MEDGASCQDGERPPAAADGRHAAAASSWAPSEEAFKPYVPPPQSSSGDFVRSSSLRVIVRKSMVARLSKDIVETYSLCNPNFKYTEALNPRRFLTNPSNGVLNDGFDNADSDLILYVNFVLVDTRANKSGQPPDQLLRHSENTKMFFKHVGSYNRMENADACKSTSAYKILTVEEYEARESKKPTMGKNSCSFVKLEDIIAHYPYRKNLSEDEILKEKITRLSLVDFARGLMEFDPEKRWSPLQASGHPFVTGEPFSCPYKPVEETPRIPVTNTIAVDHNPVGGHWLAAGLSPQVLNVPKGLRHDTSYFPMVNLSHGSYVNIGNHGSYNENVGLGSSFGSYGDVNYTYNYHPSICPSGLPMQAQVGGSLLGASPDTRRRPPPFTHGNGFGPSPSAGFGPMSLGASPSQFTPSTPKCRCPPFRLGSMAPVPPHEEVFMVPRWEREFLDNITGGIGSTLELCTCYLMIIRLNSGRVNMVIPLLAINQILPVEVLFVLRAVCFLTLTPLGNKGVVDVDSLQGPPVLIRICRCLMFLVPSLPLHIHQKFHMIKLKAVVSQILQIGTLITVMTSFYKKTILTKGLHMLSFKTICAWIRRWMLHSGRSHQVRSHNFANSSYTPRTTSGALQANALVGDAPQSRFTQNPPTRFGQQPVHWNVQPTHTHNEWSCQRGEPPHPNYGGAPDSHIANNMFSNSIPCGGRRTGHPIATILRSSHARTDYGRIT